MSVLRDKYDDLKAEWMTLQQTNQEYKRTLQTKVKEGLKLTKDLEALKRKHDNTIKDTSEDHENSLSVISSL